MIDEIHKQQVQRECLDKIIIDENAEHMEFKY